MSAIAPSTGTATATLAAVPVREGRLDVRTRVLSLLRAHGDETTSFQVLEPGLEYAFDGDDGCVAYVDTGSAWVAAGAPVAPKERRVDVAKAFVAAARRAGRRPCFFSVDRAFTEAVGLSSLGIGEEPWWRADEWDAILRTHKGLREQVRRARAKGVTVRIVAPHELHEGHETRRAMEGIIVRWLASRPLAAMGFLVDVRPFEFAEERIVAVAERGGVIVAFAAAIPIYARSAFFLEDLLRDPASPNGTAEMLVDRVFRDAHARGATALTLGMAPLSGQVSPVLARIRHHTRRLYNFDGVRAFKARLHPHEWVPVELAYPKSVPWPIAIHDVLRAFATGGFLRFGVASLRKQRRVVVLVLGALLLPWTLMVALPAEAPWFPSRGVQASWALFDAVLAVALIALYRRWSSGFATLLAGVTAIDALLTVLQVAIWDLPRVHGGISAFTLALSIAAPVLASTFLFFTRRVELEPLL